jgi:hypothetical protein
VHAWNLEATLLDAMQPRRLRVDSDVAATDPGPDRHAELEETAWATVAAFVPGVNDYIARAGLEIVAGYFLS